MKVKVALEGLEPVFHGIHLHEFPKCESPNFEATLKDGKGSVFSDEGKALIIHSGQDDGVRQPSGDSGERVACAVIKKDSELQEGTNTGEQVEQKEEEES